MSDEGGFTLLELTIATVVTLIIVMTGTALLLNGQRQQIGQGFRTESLDNARDAMTQMSRELREAARIDAPGAGLSGQVLDARVPLAPGDTDQLRIVRYDCSGTSDLGDALKTCTRAEETAAGSGVLGAPRLILDGIANEDVFRVDASGRSLAIGVEERVVGTKGGENGFENSDNPVSLSETVTIRNCTDDGLSLVPCG